jgi:hypothetical protein
MRGDVMPLIRQMHLLGIGWAVLVGCVLIALSIPIKACFPDTGSCLTMSPFHGKAGFSNYWMWDYQWPFRIVAVVVGVVGLLAAYWITWRSNRSGG